MERLDLGDGRWAELRQFEGEVAGVDIFHPDCGSPDFIPFTGRSWARLFNGRIESWDLVSEVPLHIEPSILCRACGDHGFIRGGRWVKA